LPGWINGGGGPVNDSLCFRGTRLHRLEANIQPENAAFIALVRRIGFRQEGFSPRYRKVCGIWRDHERWALLADADMG
jgi:ribosomal-protein-alanine N-acetyltransferase